MEKRAVIIVGGGPAGLSAAVALYKIGITDLYIIEREKHLGGILRQCIHDGFGLTRFGTSLSGPEYAARFINEVTEHRIPYITGATVLDITKDKVVTMVSRDGLVQFQAEAVILTMGCRERTRGALSIPGERPTGVFTAGVAQAYMNLYNRMPGKEVVILGSGDIGMIMARRMVLEGAHVQAVLEIQGIPSGLPRNIQQCLHDYEIPLLLSHTVTQIHGDSRLKGVTVSQVDEHLEPIQGTERFYSCDTLILSVGLIPENELSIDAGVELDARTRGAVVTESYETNIEGIFAAGNVLHVHDLVDFVSVESERMASCVADYVNGRNLPLCSINVNSDAAIIYTVPQRISGTTDVTISMRVKKLMKNCRIVVRQNGEEITSLRMKKALPAEMIQLIIKSNKLQGTKELEVSVE